jgi:diguanylate cyclase
MPRRLPQPDLRVPSSERLGELIGHLTDGLVGPNGQTPSGAAGLAPDLPCTAMPARPEELQRLLGASRDDNRHLTAQVLRLEAELGELRGELRGAVHDALTDPLTGLANRRAFDRELGAVGARASRSSPAHLVMADIDHFKRVNDAHGHDIGDEVLRIVGEILLANVRRDSLVARLGGDEFGLLLPGAGSPYAAAVAIRLCQALASRPIVLRGHPEVSERITLSIGMAGWQAGDSSAGWYARADAALYRAKRSGRNWVALDTRQQTASGASRGVRSGTARATDRG